MATHKALILEDFGAPLVLKDVPTSTVTLGAALVAPLYAIIPPNLSLLMSGGLKHIFPTFPPYTPGYSCIGRILSLPPDVITLQVGDLVWVDPMIRGRDNPHAQAVRSSLCDPEPGSQTLMKGPWKDGTYTEKLLVPLEGLFKVDEQWVKAKEQGGRGFKVRDFALAGYYLLALGGLSGSKVGAGDTVVVAPATGKFSSAAVLVALALGCKVVAAGRSAEKLRVLQSYHGAKERLSTVVLTGDAEADAQALKDATGGKGADVFVDYSPTSMREEPPYLMAGVKSLRRGGEYLLLGGALTDLKFPYVEVMWRELKIRGKFMWERKHVELFLRMIETGSLKMGVEGGLADALECFGLDEMGEAVGKEQGWKLGDERLLTPNKE